MKSRKAIALSVLVVVAIGLVLAWQAIRPRDPMFRGKPESVWIANLGYYNDEQVKVWRGFGADGIEVLVKALDRRMGRGDRVYRSVYRQCAGVLPASILSYLPSPRRDLAALERMRIVSLLSQLSKDAPQAAPAMLRALNDENSSVRQIAITYFSQDEDEKDKKALLNQLDDETRRHLFELFIRATNEDDVGIRNNAFVALRFFPEKKEEVIPILRRSLQDPEPLMQKAAARELKHWKVTTPVEERNRSK